MGWTYTDGAGRTIIRDGAISTEARVEAAALQILEMGGALPSATEVAMALCEEDVANGEYEGCSSELDLAASEYLAAAERVL